MRDYARIYGLRTVVFRMSCIYGPGQYGNGGPGLGRPLPDRGALGRPITIYGDGKQVRDVLFVDDLVAAFMAAVERIETARAKSSTSGAAPTNTLSLLELVEWLERHSASPVDLRFGSWRPGDQRVYVSDIRKARERLGWAPRVTTSEGLERLWRWVKSHPELFTPELAGVR